MNTITRALVASTLLLLISCGTSNSTTSSSVDAGPRLFDSSAPPTVTEEWWELGDSITHGIGTRSDHRLSFSALRVDY